MRKRQEPGGRACGCEGVEERGCGGDGSRCVGGARAPRHVRRQRRAAQVSGAKQQLAPARVAPGVRARCKSRVYAIAHGAPGRVEPHVGQQRRGKQRRVTVRGALVLRPRRRVSARSLVAATFPPPPHAATHRGASRGHGTRGVAEDIVINVCVADAGMRVLPRAHAEQHCTQRSPEQQHPAQRPHIGRWRLLRRPRRARGRGATGWLLTWRRRAAVTWQGDAFAR